ncbi:Replicase polyprotein 1a [Bienertia sinuspersici]
MGVLIYVGRQCRTFAVDSDELSWWELVDLAKKCGGYTNIESIHYHIPGQGLESELRNVYSDAEVREMVEVALKYRLLILYVVHGVDEPELVPQLNICSETEKAESTPIQDSQKKTPRKKLTPKRCTTSKTVKPKDSSTSLDGGPQSTCNEPTPLNDLEVTPLNEAENPNQPQIVTQASQAPETHSKDKTHIETTCVPPSYDWYDPRPESPLRWADLVNEGYDSSDSDSVYDPLPDEGQGSDCELDDYVFYEFEADEVDGEDEFEGDILDDNYSDISDDEYITARERVIGCNKQLSDLAQQLQKEAAKLGGAGSVGEGGVRGVVTDRGGSGDRGEGPVSDYESSDEDIRTPPTSDEGEPIQARRTRRGELVSDKSDFSVFQWKVGQRFATRGKFKNAVITYGILQGRNLSFVVSNKKRGQRVGVTCVEGCPFKLYASWDSRRGTFVVKSVVNEHTCLRIMERNRQLKSSWVAEQFLEVFKAKPHWPAKDIMQTIRLAYKVLVKKDFAYKVKYYAHKMLHGSMKDHYQKVGRYVEALKQASPGSCLEVVTDPTQVVAPPLFQRMFVSFEGLQKGWKEGCRKAIISSTASVLPSAEHRHCARQIFAHWHKRYKGDEYKLLFWNIVKAYNNADFNDAIEELEKVNLAAAEDFRSYNPQLFCRAFFRSSTRCDVVTNNMAETFNGYIIQARTKHLIYMLEDIRASLMQRLAVKKQNMEDSTSVICPRVQLKLEKNKDEAAKCQVLPSTRTVFQVNHYLDSLTVDLEGMTCTCRRWNMTGIPCCHAMAAIFFCHKKAEDYVDESLKREVYLRAYNNSIPPCDGERHWPRIQLPLDPPPIKIGPGRPRKKRRKDPHEVPKKPGKLSKHGVEMTCSHCKAKGHNKRGCTERESTPQQLPQAKRGRGRPRGVELSEVGEDLEVVQVLIQEVVQVLVVQEQVQLLLCQKGHLLLLLYQVQEEAGEEAEAEEEEEEGPPKVLEFFLELMVQH